MQKSTHEKMRAISKSVIKQKYGGFKKTFSNPPHFFF